ncbi:hypothetical protein [Glaciecola sp. SC05]|uniref:hypothetical protein n=1 Tax=Glaciecola sp. SC05 TaxID=1987355 RepID=UPI003529C05A
MSNTSLRQSFFSEYVKSKLAILAILLLNSFHPLSHANLQTSSESALLSIQPSLSLYGQWITEADGSTMLDPQTSGLIANELGWWTISDASADASQIQRLHLMDKRSAQLIQKFGPMQLSSAVLQTCFASYLSNKPDYEAMVFHPLKSDAWILVTEDATRGEPLTDQCKSIFANSGSTEYPTLLVEVMLDGQSLIVTGVRAIQFDPNDQVGNSPNDGIEGLAVGRNNRLFLGLEKDANSQPRVFYVDITHDFFAQSGTFSRAADAGLTLPQFDQGNHPINGMDIYFPNADSEGFLIAAARNDNELWVIDLAKRLPTKIIPLSFFAPSASPECPSYHKMNNASLEGVAVDGETLVVVNDPWRANYMKNVVCPADKARYERMSPLIFTTPIQSSWFLH